MANDLPFLTGDDLLGRAARRRLARSARVSSWDQTGGNDDGFTILPGERAVLADLDGPGCITHLWLVAPLGDFFCVGHSLSDTLASVPFTVSVKEDERRTLGGRAALNNYLPMPFARRARIEVENQGEVAYTQYFHVDHELSPAPPPDDVLYFHASWRREDPCDGWAPECQVSYRFHLPDPVRFSRRIRVTMEHGHANHLADDWSSTAYWYQTLPGPALDILPVQRRLPRRAQLPPDRHGTPRVLAGLDQARADLLRHRDDRWSAFQAARTERIQRQAEATRARQAANAEQARQVRAHFLESLR